MTKMAKRSRKVSKARKISNTRLKRNLKGHQLRIKIKISKRKMWIKKNLTISRIPKRRTIKTLNGRIVLRNLKISKMKTKIKRSGQKFMMRQTLS